MTIEVVPTGRAVGAEIRGVDIRQPLAQADIGVITKAWYDHLVVIIREQPMSPLELMAFARTFGELEYTGSNLVKKLYQGGAGLDESDLPPEIGVISNIIINDKPIGGLGAGEAAWHTDSSYVDVPTAGSFLHAIEIPPVGGATYFLNMYDAYEALPAPLKREIVDRKIRHAATHSSDGKPRKGFEAPITDVTNLPGSEHPIIRTHPNTGRKALFLGRRLNAYIVGCSVAESEELLDALWAHTTNDEFVYRHDWRVGDLVVWDNRCTMHRRDGFDPNCRRLLIRTQTRGTTPF